MTRLTAPWLSAPGPQALCAALEAAGHQALFVGGCVRNTLLDAPVSDLDLATDALPQNVTDIAGNAGFRTIPTGIDHGTVTVLAGEEPIEVTTFRQDVATDGRHATVAFADDVAQDAARRDFTMNALYCDARGTLVDPLDGLPDLKAGRLRFIGSASARIAEDYLRILRFFRFTAWYGNPDHGIDAEGLAACADGADGLSHVSAERITAELLKLLAAPGPAPAVAAMAASGVLHHVLPGADAPTLTRFIHFAPSPDATARLAALGGSRDGLRLSRAEDRRVETLLTAAASLAPPAALAYHHGEADALAAIRLRAAQTETVPPENAASEARHGAAQTFPVAAADLMPQLSGPALGARLKELESRWIASGFTLGREELLAP
ncbi:CCA tRNA nucleotidyltransferase [Oceanicola sp. 502str15]|uniref:CCA tRNA nucleotidyltransferase n=1 Tax=Oceanicola sp. 502str15 TaxID=2696061 RepID=UPI002095EB0F|nr:CCA tRNA nucleotidyltransferase [Oceanicola sp. 502str15]MCO6384370.1 CCA tRNA nucleotidyltransferase [Oceanicola sp. 502str15]